MLRSTAMKPRSGGANTPLARYSRMRAWIAAIRASSSGAPSQTSGRTRCSADGASPDALRDRLPVLRLRRVLIARDHRPARQVDARGGQEDLRNGDAERRARARIAHGRGVRAAGARSRGRPRRTPGTRAGAAPARGSTRRARGPGSRRPTARSRACAGTGRRARSAGRLRIARCSAPCNQIQNATATRIASASIIDRRLRRGASARDGVVRHRVMRSHSRASSVPAQPDPVRPPADSLADRKCRASRAPIAGCKRLRPARCRSRRRIRGTLGANSRLAMSDLVFVLLTGAFFGCRGCYVRACDRL